MGGGPSGDRWLRGSLDAAGRESQRLLVVADGEFSVAKMRAALPGGERVVLMSRCAKNRKLFQLPEPRRPGRRGRGRKYGQRARRPSEWLAQRQGWSQKPFVVRGRTIRARHRVEGPYVLEGAPQRPVFLVAVRGRKAGNNSKKRGQKERKPAFGWSRRSAGRAGRGGCCPTR